MHKLNLDSLIKVAKVFQSKAVRHCFSTTNAHYLEHLTADCFVNDAECKGEFIKTRKPAILDLTEAASQTVSKLFTMLYLLMDNV